MIRIITSVIVMGLATVTSMGCSSSAKKPNEKAAKLNTLLDQKFDERVDLYPESLTKLGIKKKYGSLDTWTPETEARDLTLAQENLKELKTWTNEDLDESGKISLLLATKDLEEDVADHDFRFHRYPVNQMFGRHSSIPSFLINFHKIENQEDAEAYISRINEVPRVVQELIAQLKIREEKGIILPRFLFARIYNDLNNLTQGAPLDGNSKPHVLKEDFSQKISKTKIKESQQVTLQQKLDQSLKTSFLPAYRELSAYMKNLEKKADNRAGVWKFPRGEEFYRLRLKRVTTTDLSPEAIHNLGLKETARIHDEMKNIMKKVGFKGNLKAFFVKMKTDPKFYLPDSAEGRQKYLAETDRVLKEIKARLPEIFGVLPKADLVVKPVEAFREKSAGLAFYDAPAPDGSRSGIYYVNLSDMKALPTYELEALAYHEGLPGHHMQIAIAQELQGLPKFRRFGGYTAYSEGWGLYAELAPKELNLYQDAYSDFGRLSMELWRAARLVVDTGLHWKRWTREQAARWLDDNTPGQKEDNLKAIDRYIVMPGQATGYKIGMLKIVELREKAKQKLGDKFSIKGFHDEVLRHGSVPLDTLEMLIDQWITAQSQRA